jgi:hypothetical protein
MTTKKTRRRKEKSAPADTLGLPPSAFKHTEQMIQFKDVVSHPEYQRGTFPKWCHYLLSLLIRGFGLQNIDVNLRNGKYYVMDGLQRFSARALHGESECLANVYHLSAADETKMFLIKNNVKRVGNNALCWAYPGAAGLLIRELASEGGLLHGIVSFGKRNVGAHNTSIPAGVVARILHGALSGSKNAKDIASFPLLTALSELDVMLETEGRREEAFKFIRTIAAAYPDGAKTVVLCTFTEFYNKRRMPKNITRIKNHDWSKTFREFGREYGAYQKYQPIFSSLWG